MGGRRPPILFFDFTPPLSLPLIRGKPPHRAIRRATTIVALCRRLMRIGSVGFLPTKERGREGVLYNLTFISIQCFQLFHNSGKLCVGFLVSGVHFGAYTCYIILYPHFKLYQLISHAFALQLKLFS
jgi:hypothetical protein